MCRSPEGLASTLLRALMSSVLVGNCFLPGALSRHRMTLDSDGQLRIEGHFDPALAGILLRTQRHLRRAFAHLGALMLPGGFVPGVPGADVHYAGTVPMRPNPAPNEADAEGQVAGLPGVHVVDGAALSSLPAKAHTLTIMANADRIGQRVAQRLRVERK